MNDGSDEWCDMLDYKQFSREPGSRGIQGTIRKILAVGSTTVSNTDLMDPNNKAQGIMRDIWTNDQFKATYWEGSTDCLVYVQALYKDTRLGLTPNDYFESVATAYIAQWARLKALKKSHENVGMRYREVTDGNDPDQNKKTDFTVRTSNLQNIMSGDGGATGNFGQGIFSDNNGGNDAREPLAPVSIDPPRSSRRRMNNIALSASAFCQRDLGRRAACKSNSPETADRFAFARVDGQLSTISLIDKSSAQDQGVANGDLEAALVIFDIVNGDPTVIPIGASVSQIPCCAREHD